MKILMVDNSKGWGGAEEILLSLATEMRCRGHFVGIFLRDGSLPAEKLSKGGFPLWTAKRNGLNLLLSVFKLAAVIRREKIELIHVHRSHDVFVAALAGLAGGGVPLVLTQHAKIGKGNCLLALMVSRIVAVSGFIANGVLQRFSRAKDKIIVVHNGTQTNSYSDSKPDYWLNRTGMDTKGPLLGVVGFFYKDQQELIDLLPGIRAVFPSVLLIIIGEDQHKKWMLEEKAASLGVTESIYFAGHIPHNEMHKALGALDLNLSAYKHEAFGLHVIEGMAAGTPLVAYRAGGFPEIVEHDKSGYLADSKEELQQAIISLLRDRQRLDAMGRYGRERVEREFSVTAMATKYEAVYRDLVGNPESVT